MFPDLGIEMLQSTLMIADDEQTKMLMLNKEELTSLTDLLGSYVLDLETAASQPDAVPSISLDPDAILYDQPIAI